MSRVCWCHAKRGTPVPDGGTLVPGGGYSQDRTGVPPGKTGHEYSPPKQDWGSPPPTVSTGLGYPVPPGRTGYPLRQNSRVSTCYVADSIPLAFTQEDFFVDNFMFSFLRNLCEYIYHTWDSFLISCVKHPLVFGAFFHSRDTASEKLRLP